MSIPTIKFKIKCGFCNKETGHLELPKWKYKDIDLNNEVLGIDDSRCTECQNIHGKFKKEK